MGLDGGFRIKNEDQVFIFRTLKDVVQYYGDTLTKPIKERTNELSVESARIISTWKSERDRQMETVEKIVNDLFDVNRDISYLIISNNNNNNHNNVDIEKIDNIVSRLFAPML